MEYPIWHLAVLGGGFWIALIGTFHVFLAHFAVGGGLYLALAERYARRLDSPRLLAHVKKHARFFLLVTMAGARAFAGAASDEEAGRAVLYPGDERYRIVSETVVRHYEVVEAVLPG